jgi:hypothetical protein
MESGVLGRFSNAYSISLMDSEVWSAKNNRLLIEKSFPGEFFGNWFGKSRCRGESPGMIFSITPD